LNGFDTSWKDVVGTLYHELNEFRTDADVRDAIETNENRFLGWMSAQGQEIGDQPIAVAESLSLVFKGGSLQHRGQTHTGAAAVFERGARCGRPDRRPALTAL
jgi:hypothetical protein